MNKAAITKHDIYWKLSGCTEQDLSTIVDYIDAMRRKKKQESGQIIRLQGILTGHDIDPADLKAFKQETWRHVEEEHE